MKPIAASIIGLFLSFVSISPAVSAVEVAPRISDRENIESLAELKSGQKALEKVMGQRFKSMEQTMDQRFQSMDQRIKSMEQTMDQQSEAAFRNALAGILEESFGAEVLNINEYDEQGEVFGRPEQVELDVIIQNGVLLICELKSSIDKAGMYIFERKARFYEKRHQHKAGRLIVISPMIDRKARKVAEKLTIETYSDSSEVEM